ncbi:hypothetical protein [Actinomycetospora chiangmaiensis]|uniref:hypothetical protein n=1 Tax=Actinomycetospora chiangmaiensis TaxID=402650 RepID=UPI00035DCE30|nr:hypothetical protein [Actinomycetospora chiangmaiensis]
MAGSWRPGDSVPDRWLLDLEAGRVSLDETVTALAAHEWPDATPAGTSLGDTDPFPDGGWVKTMDAAHADGRISGEQYRAIYEACRKR